MFGLVNLGNTCFLNACLQALARCPPLVDYLLKDRTKTPATRSGSKKGPLLSALQTFLTDVDGKEGTYKPTVVVQTLLQVVAACDDDWYRPRQQADAAECIQYLLDGLHDALYRPVRITIHGEAATKEQRDQVAALESWSRFFSKEYSPIVEYFYGQSQISITCDTCRNASVRYEPWMMLKVPIPGGDVVGSDVPTFEACMSKAFASEAIPDYACDTCKSRQPAVMTTRISKLPNILLLSFKRFTNTGAKIRAQIDWDLDAMSLKPWLAFDRCPFADRRARTSFRTFAVIEHNGSSRGGHYRMFAREAATWIEADDESIRAVDVGTVVSPDSYVVFLM
jgi:ubiquitin C-terminal hydrolase